MQRTIGVDKARAKLGQLAEEVAAEDEAVMLTRRGEAVAVLLSPAEYERLVETSRRAAGRIASTAGSGSPERRRCGPRRIRCR